MAETSMLPAPVCRYTGTPCAAPVERNRVRTGLTVVLTLAALLLLYGDTVASLTAIWMRSATFAHGAVIAPISIWLVWRQRQRLALVPHRPAPWALAPLAVAGAAWLAAILGNVQVMHQFCLVLMIICAVLALLGTRLTRAVAFPLAYLLLVVPFGEVLIPTLVELTTACCVTVLQLAGVPVLREHHLLTLPTGRWSVVEACSGLRYLIASLAMGAVYAQLTYRSWQRRALFIVASLAVPLVTNAVRAVAIILIGHWSDMRVALGIDHLLYGWVFFGVVSLVLFWCGERWRELEIAIIDESDTGEPQRDAGAWQARTILRESDPPRSGTSLAFMALAVLLTGAVWPASYLALSRSVPTTATSARPLQLPPPPAPWTTAPLGASDWQVQHRGAPLRWAGRFVDGNRSVTVQLTWYTQQQGRDDLLAPVPRASAPDVPQWHQTDTGSKKISVSGRHLRVRTGMVQAADTKLRVWRWYRQHETETASPAMLKLLLARARLLGEACSVAEIVVAAPYDGDPAPAEEAMAALLAPLLPAIEQELHHVAQR